MDPRFTDETKTYAEILLQNSAASANSYEVKRLRQQYKFFARAANESIRQTFEGTEEQQKIKTSSTEIPITIYKPKQIDPSKLVIFFHGGGWISFDRESYQSTVNLLADATNTIWINVEYRLAPEFKYPIWLDDASEVTEYIIANRTLFGVEPTAKIGVCGDSAGGAISASLAKTLRGIDFQILIYPAVDLLGQTASFEEFKDPMFCLPVGLIKCFMENAFSKAEDFSDPRACALLDPNLSHVPTCLLILADLDPLRDGGFEYRKMLEKAGVKTDLLNIKGVVHGFFTFPGLFPVAFRQASGAVESFMSKL